MKKNQKSFWNHQSIIKMHTFWHFELNTYKNLDFKKIGWFAFFNLENLTSKHSHFNVGQHIDLKSSLSQNLKSFLCTKLFKFWLSVNFKSLCWPILKWECFEVKFSKLKNANQPVFLKIQIFEGIKIKMAENVQFCDRIMIPKWFWVIFDFQGCYCGFSFSNLRPIWE